MTRCWLAAVSLTLVMGVSTTYGQEPYWTELDRTAGHLLTDSKIQRPDLPGTLIEDVPVAATESLDPSALGVDCTTDDDCDDGIDCTDDSCDTTTDACVNTADDTLCDNGDFCDGAGTCDPTHVDANPVTGCVAGAAPVIDDAVACTDDSCDEVNDVVVNTPNDANCDNGVFCDGTETCDALLDCQAGTPPVIDD
ncbi:MAG: hypothetical protein V3W34_18370, partial [Phycisphaerae bacterium]